MFGSKPQTKVIDFKNARARDRGVTLMARQGYTVVNVATYGGTYKKGKLFLTGIFAFFLPGGTRRSERYTVTFSKLPPSRP